jgi:hypothetical protein
VRRVPGLAFSRRYPRLPSSWFLGAAGLEMKKALLRTAAGPVFLPKRPTAARASVKPLRQPVRLAWATALVPEVCAVVESAWEAVSTPFAGGPGPTAEPPVALGATTAPQPGWKPV